MVKKLRMLSTKKNIFLIIVYILLFPCLCYAQAQEKEYYPNGIVKVERLPVSDSDALVERKYYLNGNLMSATTYIKKVKNGPFKEYSESGALVKEGSYKDGKLNGLQKTYYENGDLQQAIEYEDDVINGPLRSYYQGGILKELFNYVQGKISVPVKVYYVTGDLKAELYFDENSQEFVEKDYYESGRLQRRMEFVKNRLNSKLTEYYENQGIKSEDTIVDGKSVEHKDFDENGAVIEEPSKNQDEPKKLSTAMVRKLSDKNLKKIFKVSMGGKEIIFVIVSLIIFFVTGVFIGQILNVNENPQKPFSKGIIENNDFSEIRKDFEVLNPESEKLYRNLVETVKSGMFISDVTGRLLYVNNTFAQLFGYKTKQEAMTLNLINEFKSVDDQEKQLLKIMGESNEIYDFQFKYRLPDSSLAILSASANRIFDESGRPIGLQGMVVDITEKKQLEDDVLIEKRKLESILSFFEDIDSVRDEDTLVEFIVQGITNILEANVCMLLLQDPETYVLNIKGAKGLKADEPFDEEYTFFKHVMKSGKSLLVENLEYDKRFFDKKKPAYLKRSFLIVPLEFQDKVRGMVVVTDKHSKFQMDPPFKDADLKILTIFAGKVSVAIENIKFYSDLNLQTVIDPITKIYNYRLLSESLDREIKKASRENTDFSVLMMDVDDFKSYNDTFGHLEGDELLINLGAILKTNVRDMDIVCRYAGDEFCIVLTNASKEKAVFPATKIVKAVENFAFKKTVTVSIGIAGYEQGMTKKELIGKADQALYQAKNEGKNKIAVFTG